MAVIASINGNASGEGFLIAPFDGANFEAHLGVRTNDGSTVNATLQMASDGAGVVLESTNVTITPTESFVKLHATAASGSRNDTVLEVLEGATVVAGFDLTAIEDVQVFFQGRFQARFATDNDYYNDPRGNPDGTNSGWNFTLEGEPDFVPSDSVADRLDKPVGRQVRFNNPVSLRPHADAIGVSVISITGTAGSSTEEFTVGDAMIGMPVNLGDDSYFAGNNPVDPADTNPEEKYGAAVEPIGLFEFHIGDAFSGRSQVGPYSGAVSSTNPRTPDDRPQAAGLAAPTADEVAAFAIGSLADWSDVRINALAGDYNALSSADQTGTAAGRNLATRIRHLLSSASGSVASSVSSSTSLSSIGVGTLSVGWSLKEVYAGLINDSININPVPSDTSAVLKYLALFNSFDFTCNFLRYHSDEQCGGVGGRIEAITTDLVPDVTSGVYDAETLSTTSFSALTIPDMTPDNIDGIIGGSGTAEKLIVTVSPDLNRLVVSRAVITNPADAPADWAITSRGETLVGMYLPEASVFPREHFYVILQPGHEQNVLGSCEGALMTPGPTVGFARLYAEGSTWKIILHAGTNGSDGVTYAGAYAGSPAITPTGCALTDVELLTTVVDFGDVEEGMTMYRQIVVLNRSTGNLTVTLPAIPSPFGAPADTSVVAPAGELAILLVSYIAGTVGSNPSTDITLSTTPSVSGLVVTLTGQSIAASTVDAVLVLDRSGSMSEPAISGPRETSKATLRDQAAQVFVDLLRPDDRIGMVRYNADAQEHMALEEAGDESTGTGRANAATALASSDLDPSGATSVGDGMFEGNSMLTAAGSTADRHSMVVLTDGKENRDLRIADITLGTGVSAYAVGLGLPQNVNSEKLSAVTGNTGGYMLVTGELDEANEFRLHKYYAQILSGISGDDIVVDPRGVIYPGQTHRIPFYLTEADTHFDAVLLTQHSILRIELEAPDGTRMTPANLGAYHGKFVNGGASRYFRMDIPTIPGPVSRSLGKWHLIVYYPGNKKYGHTMRERKQGDATNDVGGHTTHGDATVGIAALTNRTFVSRVDDQRSGRGRSYSVLVRARSSINLEVSIEQSGFAPGQTRLLQAQLTAFGLPYDQNVKLMAMITRPDGAPIRVPLAPKGNGRFEAALTDARLPGLYETTVKVLGMTPGNYPIQREKTVSAMVIMPVTDDGRPGGGGSGGGIVAGDIADIVKANQDAMRRLIDTLERRLLSPVNRYLLLWLPILLLILILVLILIIWDIA